jgi:hypothetical protein
MRDIILNINKARKHLLEAYDCLMETSDYNNKNLDYVTGVIDDAEWTLRKALGEIHSDDKIRLGNPYAHIEERENEV